MTLGLSLLIWRTPARQTFFHILHLDGSCFMTNTTVVQKRLLHFIKLCWPEPDSDFTVLRQALLLEESPIVRKYYINMKKEDNTRPVAWLRTNKHEVRLGATTILLWDSRYSCFSFYFAKSWSVIKPARPWSRQNKEHLCQKPVLLRTKERFAFF